MTSVPSLCTVYTLSRADIPKLFTLDCQNRSLIVGHEGPRAHTYCIEYTCICQMLQCGSSGAKILKDKNIIKKNNNNKKKILAVQV